MSQALISSKHPLRQNYHFVFGVTKPSTLNYHNYQDRIETVNEILSNTHAFIFIEKDFKIFITQSKYTIVETFKYHFMILMTLALMPPAYHSWC